MCPHYQGLGCVLSLQLGSKDNAERAKFSKKFAAGESRDLLHCVAYQLCGIPGAKSRMVPELRCKRGQMYSTSRSFCDCSPLSCVRSQIAYFGGKMFGPGDSDSPIWLSVQFPFLQLEESLPALKKVKDDNVLPRLEEALIGLWTVMTAVLHFIRNGPQLHSLRSCFPALRLTFPTAQQQQSWQETLWLL